MKLNSLTKNCGVDNIAGTAVDLYYTCSCEIDGWPTTKAEGGGTDEGDTITLGSAFDFSAAPSGEGYWRKAKILTDSGEIFSVLEGELGGQGFKNSFTFYVEGNDVAQLEFAEQMRKYSGCLIFGMKDRHGNNRILGNQNVPAMIETADVRTALKSGEKRGAAYTVTAATGKIAPVYDAALEWKVVPNV